MSSSKLMSRLQRLPHHHPKVRDSLSRFATALEAVNSQLHAADIEQKKAEMRARLYGEMATSVDEEHQKILSRRLIIERRKEELVIFAQRTHNLTRRPGTPSATRVSAPPPPSLPFLPLRPSRTSLPRPSLSHSPRSSSQRPRTQPFTPAPCPHTLLTPSPPSLAIPPTLTRTASARAPELLGPCRLAIRRGAVGARPTERAPEQALVGTTSTLLRHCPSLHTARV